MLARAPPQRLLCRCPEGRTSGIEPNPNPGKRPSARASMIPRSTNPRQAVVSRKAPAESWRRHLREAVSDPRELLAMAGLDPATHLPGAREGQRLFAQRVPRGFIARMRRGDPADPLLRQVLPLGVETREAPGFVSDPVGDLDSMTVPGLLHKYRGRVLLVVTGACAVNCRYCFRRHFPYGDASVSRSRLQPALDYIANDAGIEEVILSGGDPLTLGTDRLREVTDALAAIPHVRRLRIHSRMPVVLPERVDPGLLDWLEHLPWQRVMVIHANHANEIDDLVAHALAALRARGVTLLNQAVLLAGVNDRADRLCALSERLFAEGVMPYYLHWLDRVQGAAHFEVEHTRALSLYRDAAARLPGYLVPRLVREDAGAPYKVNVV